MEVNSLISQLQQNVLTLIFTGNEILWVRKVVWIQGSNIFLRPWNVIVTKFLIEFVKYVECSIENIAKKAEYSGILHINVHDQR